MKDDQRLVVYDGILMKCSIINQTYVPEESANLEDLVATLKDGLLNQSSPSYQHQETRRFSRVVGQLSERTPYKPFYKHKLRSDGDVEIDEDLGNSLSSPTRKKSSTSNNGIPHSVLIPLRKEPSLSHESFSEDEVFDEEKQSVLKTRLVDQLNWMKTKGDDCVALETLNNIQELMILLRVFMAFKTPAALEFKINHDSTITVSYQFLHNFKNDFMMLKVHGKYCMFMSPF